MSIRPSLSSSSVVNIFTHFAKFLKNCSVTFLAPQPKAAAELFKCRFVRRRRRPSSSVRRRRPSTFSCNLLFLKNRSATFFLIAHVASIICSLVTHVDLNPPEIL